MSLRYYWFFILEVCAHLRHFCYKIKCCFIITGKYFSSSRHEKSWYSRTLATHELNHESSLYKWVINGNRGSVVQVILTRCEITEATYNLCRITRVNDHRWELSFDWDIGVSVLEPRMCRTNRDWTYWPYVETVDEKARNIFHLLKYVWSWPMNHWLIQDLSLATVSWNCQN